MTATSAVRSAQRRTQSHRVMRQLHLWIGAWGALAAVLFGFTGLVQNHRALLKIPQGDATELANVELPVPDAARATPDAMRAWLSTVRMALSSSQTRTVAAMINSPRRAIAAAIRGK